MTETELSHHFDGLRNKIPLEEAASFFVRIKTAEWTEPPDMEGELEGQFAVPVEQVLAKLKEVLTSKFRKMVAYHTYAQCMRGPSWRAAKIEFGEHAYDEQKGAEFYTKRAVALGGPVHMDEIEPPPASNNPLGILKIMARAEQEGILVQRELLQMVGDENPMRIGIEEHMSKDQHHLDENWQMMTQEEHALVERGMEDADPEASGELPTGEEEVPEGAGAEEGGAPEESLEEPQEDMETDPELEELPSEEKVASMRMALALQKLGMPGMGVPQPPAVGGAGVAPAMSGAGAAATPKMGGGLLGGAPKPPKMGSTKIAAEMRLTRALEKRADDGAAAGEAQMTPPAAGQEQQPQNYLQAEMAGQQAQEANESGYYRQQLHESSQQMESMQQQVQMAQEQLQGLQQQAEEANMNVQQAAQSAQQAHDMATEQTMQAAKARIGAQQMRQQMLQLASQDPQALGEQAMGPSPEEMAAQQAQEEGGMPGAEGGQAPGETPPDGAGGPPAEAEGPAGAAPDPQAAPGSAPPEGQSDTSAPSSGASPAATAGGGPPSATPVQVKVGSARMLGAAVGAGLGAGAGVIQGARAPGLRQKVEDLKSKQGGGFMEAARLAKAQAASATADLAEGHPAVSAIKGGLMGAAGGALMGPSLAQRATKLRKDIPDAAREVGSMIGMR